MTFAELIQVHGLARSEGVVLRYLSDAYRTLRHTVPDRFADDDLEDLIAWLGELIRQTDSSLLDEWEELVNPGPDGPRQAAEARPRPFTGNRRALTVAVRNAMFHRVELAARDDVDALAALEQRVAELTEPPQSVAMDAVAWDEALGAYWDEHDEIGIDAEARSPARLQIDEQADHWGLRQAIADPAGHGDWAITARLDLAASDEAGAAVVLATGFGRLD